MAKSYQNFIFFASMRESVEALPEELGNKLLRAIMIYGTEGIVVDDDPTVVSVLCSMKPNIDNTHLQHEKAVKRREEWDEELKKKKLEKLNALITVAAEKRMKQYADNLAKLENANNANDAT